MKFSALSHIFTFALGAILFGMSSCSDEIVAPVTIDDQPLKEGGINFRCADMLEVNYGAARTISRSGDSKDPDEKKIKSLHVFFFNPEAKDGKHELLEPSYPEEFPSYQRIIYEDIDGKPIKDTDGNPLNLSNGFLAVPEKGDAPFFFKNVKNDDVIVVALANIDATDYADNYTSKENTFLTKYDSESGGLIQRDSRKDPAEGEDVFVVTCLEDLESWVYHPRMRMDEETEEGDVQGLPEAGMPMICAQQKISLTKGSENIVRMVAMMAKVNVTVQLKPNQYTSQFPYLEITEYGVRNMPVAVPFKAPTGELREDATVTSPAKIQEKIGEASNHFDACKDIYSVTTASMYHKGPKQSDMGEACDPQLHEFVTTLATPRIINKDSAPVKFTYYTYENINVPDYAAERANGDDAYVVENGEFKANYPEGLVASDYQRWKSTLAYTHRASALVLKGTYTNHQGMHYKAQFTVYLGKDADSDFTVRRNHQYDNAITIRGLEYIRNSTDDVYTFDGRVNVVDDNPFYLAIVNERNVDAHASALPMDVWMMYREPSPGQTEAPEIEHYSEITITIPEKDNKGGNARDWVQMVMIPRAEMEAGHFTAGTGCEPYFYTNLINDIKDKTVLTANTMGGIGYPGHYEGADCGYEVKIVSTPGKNGGDVNNSRARVYFYIDENTTISDADSAAMLTNPKHMDRSVTIDIAYRRYSYSESGARVELDYRKRTLEIEQRGLRRVPTTWRGNNNENPENIPETYIEYTEEYLTHYDPLEPHNETGEFYRDGLPWGLSDNGGVPVNYSTSYTSGFVNNYDGSSGHTSNTNILYNPANGYAYNIYKKNSALAFTQWAIPTLQDDDSKIDVRKIKLFNTEIPESAFHYCYGKNKRNYDGTVTKVSVPSSGSNSSTKSWYMPGIKELETALVAYWNDFSDFQGQLYWSCSCGPCPYVVRPLSGASVADPNNIDNRYARATKVDASGKYINSGIGEPGYLLRSSNHRIRAFYRRN